jgi:hypothetical protein
MEPNAELVFGGKVIIHLIIYIFFCVGVSIKTTCAFFEKQKVFLPAYFHFYFFIQESNVMFIVFLLYQKKVSMSWPFVSSTLTFLFPLVCCPQGYLGAVEEMPTTSKA